MARALKYPNHGVMPESWYITSEAQMTVCVPIKDMKNTAEFTDTVRRSPEPVFVTKNGREAIVSMSPEVYEGLRREAARARLYDVVERGLEDVRSGRTADAEMLIKNLRAAHGA